jgi:hypothetical protein
MLRRLFLFTFICALFAIPQTGNAQLVFFDLEGQAGSGLLPGNEVGGASSTGSGDVLTQIVFDTSTSVLSIDVGWGSGNGFTDLTGDVTAMHIHGPAGFTSNAGVLYNLGGLAGFDASATSGGLNDSLTIDSGDVQTLLDGNMYINVHTADNGGGELRANLVNAIPEPSGLLLTSLAGLGFCFRRRRGHVA